MKRTTGGRAALFFSTLLFVVAAAGAMPQESFPPPPADRSLIYLRSMDGSLLALPFESGLTPLRLDVAAKGDKHSYIELSGGAAATSVEASAARFYLFVRDEGRPHPPLLVRLTKKGRGRQVKAMAQRGYTGFAIPSEEIITPSYRVLARDGQLLYMEISTRTPLEPGEYALIGGDLARIATFRVAPRVP